MANETIITVVGNLTGDPELRFTPSGAAVANFTVASTPSHYNKDSQQWEDGEAMFLNCSAWREMAENVAESLVKGTRVVVQGKLGCRRYTNREGVPGVSWELDVLDVGPSLRWASANITRNQGSQSSGGGRGGASVGGRAPQARTQQNQAPARDPWAAASTDEPPF